MALAIQLIIFGSNVVGNFLNPPVESFSINMTEESDSSYFSLDKLTSVKGDKENGFFEVETRIDYNYDGYKGHFYLPGDKSREPHCFIENFNYHKTSETLSYEVQKRAIELKTKSEIERCLLSVIHYVAVEADDGIGNMTKEDIKKRRNTKSWKP